MKQFTLTKEEFITRAMAGEVFISIKYGSRFHYDNTQTIPFRLSNDPLDQAWKIFDEKELFTLEPPKPRIERRWKWRQDSTGYTNESSYINDDYARNHYSENGWYKVEDCFIDVEIKE